MTRPRVLALHGYHGSGATLRAQLAPLITGLDDAIELVAIDAPALAEGDFGWWHAEDGIAGARGGKHYRGWARTRAAIAERVAHDGPFAGVLGFSQGAALTGLLVGVPEIAFDFAILVSGFASNDPEHAALYANRAGYARPSLHLIGRSDSVVPSASSHALAARFDAPTIVEHAGGHVIAASADVRERVHAFVRGIAASGRA